MKPDQAGARSYTMAMNYGRLAAVVGTSVGYMWLAFLGVWLLTALNSKAVRQPEAWDAGRLLYRALSVLGVVMLAGPWLDYGLLGERFVPRNPAILLAGATLTATG